MLKTIGSIYRGLPNFPGKGLLAMRFLAPFLRGKGYEEVVDMKSAGGGKLICNIDDLIPWYVFIYGRYQIEKNYEIFLVDLIKENSLIFDIGANIGYYTVQMGRSAKAAGRIVAFEPCDYQCTQLQRNIDVNELNNITIVKKIVTNSSEGTKKIYFSGMENTGSSSTEVVTDQFEEVGCVTVDEYCIENDLQKIDLIKIDVEGHELGVLEGMKALLAEGRVQNLLLEINSIALAQADSSAQQIVDYLASYSYHASSIASGTKQPYIVGRSESLVYFSR